MITGAGDDFFGRCAERGSPISVAARMRQRVVKEHLMGVIFCWEDKQKDIIILRKAGSRLPHDETEAFSREVSFFLAMTHVGCIRF